MRLPVLVQHLLGHASAQTTQRYAHLADSALREASGAVCAAMVGNSA